MILKNLMEENQLDFNQPLLSVRRFSSTATSENGNKRKPHKSEAKHKLPPPPAYKSELKSGPVSNPGTVPFVWEKTPGRPKVESRLQTRAIERPSIAPKLPPGRVSKVEHQDYDKVPKGTSFTQVRTGSIVSNSQSIASSDNKEKKHESVKEIIQEKTSSGSDDGDEAYQDALDTLSRTESFFMTCSMSGLSAWDDQEVQASANISTDQQARDFMIRRFLPAAKAMASETPQVQYTSRKTPVTQVQPRQVKKVVSVEKHRPLNQKWQKVLSHYVQDIGKEEREDESDDDDGSENYAPKVCGLFPRFCLLNPIPGLKMEDKVLNSKVRGMQATHKIITNEHARTVNNGNKSVNTPSGSSFAEDRGSRVIRERSNYVIVPHRRGCSELLSSERTQCEPRFESPAVEKTLYVDSVQKVKSSTSCSSAMNGSTNHLGDDFETIREDSGIDMNLAIGSSLKDSKSSGIVDEKATLTSKNTMSHDPFCLICSDNSRSDMLMEIKNHSNKMYFEKQELTQSGYQKSNLDNDLVESSSLEAVECKNIGSESKVSRSKESSDSLIQNPVSLRNITEIDLKNHGATKSVDQECSQGSSHQDSSASAGLKVANDEKIDLERRSIYKLGRCETSNANSLKLPLSLPLPKAPSESWLKRTLPTVSLRNTSRSSVAANFPEQTQTSKTASVDPKWEIIVESNVHHGHLRSSEEPLGTIPEA